MRKFQIIAGALFIGFFSIMGMNIAYAEEDFFDVRLCVPLPAIAHALAKHEAEGKRVRAEHVGGGTLRMYVNNVMTVWKRLEGTEQWCFQQHLGGQGA